MKDEYRVELWRSKLLTDLLWDASLHPWLKEIAMTQLNPVRAPTSSWTSIKGSAYPYSHLSYMKGSRTPVVFVVEIVSAHIKAKGDHHIDTVLTSSFVGLGTIAKENLFYLIGHCGFVVFAYINAFTSNRRPQSRQKTKINFTCDSCGDVPKLC